MKIYLVIFIYFSSGFHYLFSQSSENILDGRTDVSPAIEILEELGHNYSIQEIYSGQLDSSFVSNKVIGNRKYGQMISVWARIKLRTSASKISSWILKTNKLYGNVTCYTRYSDGKIDVQRSGWCLAPVQRSIHDPDVVFNLTLVEGQSAVVYLHIVTNPRWSSLDLVQAKLISSDNWHTLTWKTFSLMVFYFGICILAIFYWLITFIYSLRVNYLHLIFSVSSATLFYLDNYGISTTLFWDELPWYYLAKYGQIFIWLPFMMFSTTVLMIKFNHFRQELPFATKILWCMVWLNLLIYYSFPVFFEWRITYVAYMSFSLASALWGYGMLLFLWLGKSKKGAAFAFIAYFPMISGYVFFYLSAFGFMPDTFGINMIAPTGGLISVIMLFYGMVNYVRALRKKRENEQKEKQKLILEQNIMLEQKVEERTSELNLEKQKTDELLKTSVHLLKKSDELLLNILPAEVAEELKLKGSAIARDFETVTVMFTDFKDFTKISEQLSPAKLVEEIDFCFKAFDNIIHKHTVEKIKTIGDSYMCAGGLPVKNETHAEDVVKTALEIRDFMSHHNNEKRVRGEFVFEIRIGINTGSVVAGIVGLKKFAYDIWGDAVNVASRMESSGEPGKVNISGTTYELIKNNFDCTYRGKMKAKNKGEIDMYFVND